MTLFKTPISRTPANSPIAKTSMIVIMLIVGLVLVGMSACKKESEAKTTFDYNLLYNTKWIITSQTTTPTWTYPATGKSYTDLFDFAKEIFPCVVDDYLMLYPNGNAIVSYAGTRCNPNDTSENAPPGYFLIDKTTDSLYMTFIFEVPNQKPTLEQSRSKVLELNENTFVVRYNQVVPFTFTLQTNTQTYKAMP